MHVKHKIHNKTTMKSRLLVHITCEIIIITVIGLYFHKRIKKISEDIETLKKENSELRLELEDTRRVLSSFILQQPSSSPPSLPIPDVSRAFVPRQREKVVFHPMSSIKEEDEEKCRLGLSELEEEGSILNSSSKTEAAEAAEAAEATEAGDMFSKEKDDKKESDRDTVSVITFNVPVSPRKRRLCSFGINK